MTTPPALLLVGDGARDEDGAEAFRSFAGELAGHNPEFPVAVGFVESSQPSLADSVAGLVADGVTRIAALPLALVSAGRAGEGMPPALARELERHPDVSCTWGRALGPDPTVLSVLERRLDQAVSGDGDKAHTPSLSAADADIPEPRAPRTPDDRSRTTVLLVGPGSPDPYANAEVHRAARLLWEGRGYAGVEVAFVSFAAPDVASGLDRCRKLGARKVVVLPYFLFAGGLSKRVRQQSEGWGVANRDVEVVPADVIGGEQELAGLVLERYREAVAELPVLLPQQRPEHVDAEAADVDADADTDADDPARSR